MSKYAILVLFINFTFGMIQKVANQELGPSEESMEDFGVPLSCFAPVSQGSEVSSFHQFLKCAKDLTEKWTGMGMGEPLSRCLWLDNLDYCLHKKNPHNIETDCIETFQTMIAEQVEDVSFEILVKSIP